MNVVAHLNTALAGRYTIEQEVGAGGMATVYLARDLRHARRVAVKVLNPELGAVLGVERFLSEIRVTAGLQHPNLLPLFDSGEADGLLFYVMPFVEGESLRRRLTREKQLPVDESIRIACAIADSLDYAHRHGVIHRDLKPENILLHEGRPVVADFGIALAVSNAGGTRITQTGLSLGTPQYMSPEQATGDREIDGRSDIYSLGAVLYEMLTGDPPHTGSTSQAIIARVLTDKPRPVRHSRESVPPPVEAAVDKALAKLPADRFPTARAFVDALESPAVAVAASPALPQQTLRRLRATAWPAASAIVAAAAMWAWQRAARAEPPVTRFTIPLELTDASWAMSRGNPLAISPDGRNVAYVGGSSAQRLFVRSLDDSHARVLPGTESAYDPVFSPDGRWIAFISGERLAKVPVEGGNVLTIADLPPNLAPFWGIDWGINDSIAISANGRIAIIASSAADSLGWMTAADSSRRGMRIWPRWSPDGRWLFFVDWHGSRADARIVAQSVRDGRLAKLRIPGIMPLGFIDDQLIYSSRSGALMAIPLSVRTADTTGGPTQLGDSAVGGFNFAKAALSRSGSLVFMTGAFAREVVGLDLQQHGSRTLLADRRGYTFMRMSPDGKRLALAVQSAAQEQISIYDLESRTLTALSAIGGVSQRPEWTPDGKRVIYRSDPGDASVLLWQPVDGSGPPVPVLKNVHNVWEGVLSPDGHILAYRTGTVGSAVIWLQRLDDTSAKPRAIGDKASTEWGARFSPNGRWLAYSSNRGGARQVFIESVSGSGGRRQISDEDGADTPVWSPDGRRLFYMVNSERIVMANLEPEPSVRVLGRTTLLDGGYFLNTGHANFDVSPDGRELLLLKTVASDAELVVASNWREQVRARLRASTTSQKR